MKVRAQRGEASGNMKKWKIIALLHKYKCLVIYSVCFRCTISDLKKWWCIDMEEKLKVINYSLSIYRMDWMNESRRYVIFTGDSFVENLIYLMFLFKFSKWFVPTCLQLFISSESQISTFIMSYASMKIIFVCYAVEWMWGGCYKYLVHLLNLFSLELFWSRHVFL